MVRFCVFIGLNVLTFKKVFKDVRATLGDYFVYLHDSFDGSVDQKLVFGQQFLQSFDNCPYAAV